MIVKYKRRAFVVMSLILILIVLGFIAFKCICEKRGIKEAEAVAEIKAEIEAEVRKAKQRAEAEAEVRQAKRRAKEEEIDRKTDEISKYTYNERLGEQFINYFNKGVDDTKAGRYQEALENYGKSFDLLVCRIGVLDCYLYNKYLITNGKNKCFVSATDVYNLCVAIGKLRFIQGEYSTARNVYLEAIQVLIDTGVDPSDSYDKAPDVLKHLGYAMIMNFDGEEDINVEKCRRILDCYRRTIDPYYAQTHSTSDNYDSTRDDILCIKAGYIMAQKLIDIEQEVEQLRRQKEENIAEIKAEIEAEVRKAKQRAKAEAEVRQARRRAKEEEISEAVAREAGEISKYTYSEKLGKIFIYVINLGIEDIKAGRYQKAVENYSRAFALLLFRTKKLECYPDNKYLIANTDKMCFVEAIDVYKLYVARGKLHFIQGEYELSAEAYAQAILILIDTGVDPSDLYDVDPDVLKHLGYALLVNFDEDDTEEDKRIAERYRRTRDPYYEQTHPTSEHYDSTRHDYICIHYGYMKAQDLSSILYKESVSETSQTSEPSKVNIDDTYNDEELQRESSVETKQDVNLKEQFINYVNKGVDGKRLGRYEEALKNYEEAYALLGGDDSRVVHYPIINKYLVSNKFGNEDFVESKNKFTDCRVYQSKRF